MVKHFCDCCGELIWDYHDDETEFNNCFKVFGEQKDICPVCRDFIKEFLNGNERKTTDQLNSLKSLVRKMFNRERVLRSTYFTTDDNDKLAIKIYHDKTLSEIKDRLKDEIGG